MIPLKQLKLNKIKEYISGIANFAAEHLFFTFLILIIFSLLLGLIVFYKYYILSQKIEPELETKTIGFQEDTYQKILEEWQGRGEKFEAAGAKDYPDLFK